MKKRDQQIGRLAFRREGARVNAYFARPDSMLEAILIGSILVSVCEADPKVWDGFKNLMRDAFGGIVFQETGVRPDWGDEQPAPEHERAGRA